MNLELIRTPPTITFRVECWHNETRYRTVTESHTEYHNGRSEIVYKTRQEAYTERVVDYTHSEPFHFERWTDESRNPDTLPLDQNKVTRIKLQKLILAGDHATREKLDEQKQEMKTRAKRMYPMSNVDFQQIDDIHGFKSRVASYLNGFPWWMKTRYYCCMSLCGLTWLYRWRFNRSTQKSAFDIHKSVFIV